ncbi:MAG: DNA translocase FtsK 4TM domain-containing protein [Chloracidobacterium sp.]|nr:DNA translocase FtsK 4TM domain-containing protein [Chloracidobacterium sp.]MCO5333216.1 DNA translocase FtsK 4TM domain-containing protein [Pyrinomonadaceae bacterium]
MKTCPTCKKTYDDETNFCLADGSTLLKSKRAKAATHTIVNDIVALLLVALAILVLLCLLSGSPDDRSWLPSSSSGAPIKNWIGVAGATIFALLYNSLGWSAYFVPVLIVMAAYRVYRADTLVPRVSRVLGFIFFAVALSGIFSLLGGYGAVVGEAAAQGLAHYLSRIGAGILLLTIFVCSLLLVTDASLAAFLSHFDMAWANFKIRFDEWRERRRSAQGASPAHIRAEERRRKRLAEKDAVIPPTIAVPEVPSANAVRGEPLFEHEQFDSVPTIEKADDPYATTIDEAVPVTESTSENDAAPAAIGASAAEEDEEVLPDAGAGDQDFTSYKLPDIALLTEAPPSIGHKEDELRSVAIQLEEKAGEFSVPGKVMHISPGPVVTTFEFKPASGVKYSRVTGLADDLCLALAAPSIRIDRIPGKAYVGIEVPNKQREMIYLRDVIDSPKFKEASSLLTLGLGKTIDGTKYVADLAKMPHLLIAGATGAGKSVGVNTLVMSILYKAKPDQVKFIMVDPKRLELGLYADIPHLSVPIITDPKRAATALKWAVREMEKRYKDLAGYGVRNIDSYNVEAKRRNDLGQYDENGDKHRNLPYIVIIIDELADLMMVAGKEVEESITRLAQMARAVGIHLVLATQRPSVDVITGLIKANFPSRISFRVSSRVDSRTIIDGNGAERLLGQGDMLFLPPGNSQVVRVHGAFVNEDEIKKVVESIKNQGRPEYDLTITKTEEEVSDDGESPGRRDVYFDDALRLFAQFKKASTSLLQRQLRIGYGRAAALIDAMVAEGFVGEMDGGTRARPILDKAYEYLQDLDEGARGVDA